MNIPGKIKKIIFYRQHPETALRYLPIVFLLKKEKLDKSKILEVGSGSYGITPYLKRKIIGVDTTFDEPEYPLLEQKVGSTIKLPFDENSFDVVILSDVLEHLPKEIRAQAVNEAIRVSRKKIIISGPFGKEAARQDKLLAKYSVRKIGKMHPFFKDHLKYGLPETIEVRQWISKNPKVKKIWIAGHFLNLKSREKLMKFYISKYKLQYYFYLKGLMLLVPILLKSNQQPCYRTIIEIEIK
jgi:predicted SAM-dependent methyltransferase